MQPYPTIQNYGYGSNSYGYPQQPMAYQDRLAQLQNQYNQVMPYIHMMPPFMDGMYDDEYMDMIPEDYRMGYHRDKRMHEEMPMEHKGSRRGETYDRYRDNRRHYTDTRDAEFKKQMDESMKEYMDDAMDSMKEMWKDADPQLKQSMKAELTKLVQQLQ